MTLLLAVGNTVTTCTVTRVLEVIYINMHYQFMEKMLEEVYIHVAFLLRFFHDNIASVVCHYLQVKPHIVYDFCAFAQS